MTADQRIKRLVREPITWFVLLGGLVFALDQFTGETPELEITVDQALRERLSMVWQASYGRPPNPDELRGIINEHLVEEMLYREALSLGLDEQDQIIRRRLAQKIRFLSEDSLLLDKPSEEALREWFVERQEDYARVPTISFHHIYINPEAQGPNLEQKLKEVSQRLAEPAQSQSPPIGDLFLLPNAYNQAPLHRVANDLGSSFVSVLESLPVRRWSQPIESAYGLHFVWIQHRNEGAIPEFDEVLEELSKDYERAQREAANEAFIERLAQKYQVIELPETITLAQPASP